MAVLAAANSKRKKIEGIGSKMAVVNNCVSREPAVLDVSAPGGASSLNCSAQHLIHMLL
jgi:hypothetical protein